MADPTIVATAGTLVQAPWGSASGTTKALPAIDIPGGLVDSALIVVGAWGDSGSRQFVSGQLGGVSLVEYTPSEGEQNVGDFVGGSVFYLQNPTPGTDVSLSLTTSHSGMWCCATAFLVENFSEIVNGDTNGAAGYQSAPSIVSDGPAGAMKLAAFTLYDSGTNFSTNETQIGATLSDNAFINAQQAVSYTTDEDATLSLDCTLAANGGFFALVLTILGTTEGGSTILPQMLQHHG